VLGRSELDAAGRGSMPAGGIPLDRDL
jgi:hypothetical protein